MTSVLTLPTDPPDTGDMWGALCELANVFPGTWTLIGAQMVALHALQKDRIPPRRSDDADALVEARTMAHSTPRDLAQQLLDLGYEQDPPGGIDGLIGHRFRRAPVVIDVLAPDHLGRRADLQTVPPSHTVAVPGGRRALERRKMIPVTVGKMRAQLPTPDLIGAIVVKTCAVDVDDAPRNQRMDLTFLYSLIEDPRALTSELTRSDRRTLRLRRELTDPTHEAWRSLGEHASDGFQSFTTLTGNRS